MILEREAIALVCRNPQSDLSEIIQVFEQTAADIAAEDYRDYSNYNQALHMAIWSARRKRKAEADLVNTLERVVDWG